MIANLDKFHGMIFQKQDKNSQTNLLNVDNKIIETTKSVKLLNITTDDQLRLDEHISLQKSFPLEIYLVNVTKSAVQIWSHLLKKPLMENFIFCAVYLTSPIKFLCN